MCLRWIVSLPHLYSCLGRRGEKSLGGNSGEGPMFSDCFCSCSLGWCVICSFHMMSYFFYAISWPREEACCCLVYFRPFFPIFLIYKVFEKKTTICKVKDTNMLQSGQYLKLKIDITTKSFETKHCYIMLLLLLLLQISANSYIDIKAINRA
jgi:hypothetical protein